MKHGTKGNKYKIEPRKFRLGVGNPCFVFNQESDEAQEEFAQSGC